MGTIIYASRLGIKGVKHPAGQAQLEYLAYHTPPNVWINGSGEVVPDLPGAGLATGPEYVMDFISTNNIILADYCPWPMYYRISWAQQIYLERWVGFRKFLSQGNMLFNHDFNPPATFQYARSIRLLESPPTGPLEMMFNTSTPYIPDNVYSSFAINHPFAGTYTYAYGDGGKGVTPQAYASMINEIAGMTPPEPDPPLPPEEPDDPDPTMPSIPMDMIVGGLALGGAIYLIRDQAQKRDTRYR